ncbi:sugar ABC transporter permease [Synergistales bacterium]|nr:sugar ABC transporter permease [Synergistales bacterium]
MKLMKQTPPILWAIIILFIVFSLFAKGFVQMINLQNILKNTSILIIVACGMTMVIISAGIDLSIGLVMSLAGIVASMYMQYIGKTHTFFDVATAIIIGLAIGGAFGLFNGVMIGKFKFDFLLITFSSMSIAAGLGQVISGGEIISGFSRTYRFIGGGSVGPVNMVVIIALIIALFMIFIMKKTRFGLHVYAIGDSVQCAHQSGVNVTSVLIKIYFITGLLAGFGGVLLASKTNSISPIAGRGYEFDAVAAVVVGGTPLDGGVGGIWGTIMGAILIAMMKNGLMLFGFSTFWQQTLIGVFMLLIIVGDVLSTNRRKHKAQRRIYRDAA